jgi:hypothetical protein
MPESVAGGKFNLKLVKVVEDGWGHAEHLLPVVVLGGGLFEFSK